MTNLFSFKTKGVETQGKASSVESRPYNFLSAVVTFYLASTTALPPSVLTLQQFYLPIMINNDIAISSSLHSTNKGYQTDRGELNWGQEAADGAGRMK